MYCCFRKRVIIVFRWKYLHVLKLVECKTFHDNTCGNKSLDVWINGFLCSFAILINCTNPFVFKTIWKMLNRIFWVTNRNCQTNNKITREAIITLEQYTFRRVLTYVFSTILWYIWRFLFKYTIKPNNTPQDKTYQTLQYYVLSPYQGNDLQWYILNKTCKKRLYFPGSLSLQDPNCKEFTSIGETHDFNFHCVFLCAEKESIYVLIDHPPHATHEWFV